MNFEHSWGDGVAVLRLFEELYKDSKPQNYLDNPTMEGVIRLNFDLSPHVKNAIEEVKKEVEERCNSLSVTTLQYKKYGKNYIKALKLSPDAVLQLAIQVGNSLYHYQGCHTHTHTHRWPTIGSISSVSLPTSLAVQLPLNMGEQKPSDQPVWLVSNVLKLLRTVTMLDQSR